MVSAIVYLLHIFSSPWKKLMKYLAKCGIQRNVDENQSQGKGECVLVTYTQAILKGDTCSKVIHSIVQ